MSDFDVYDETAHVTHDGWEAVSWSVYTADGLRQVIGWGDTPNAARVDLANKIVLIGGRVTQSTSVTDITPTCDHCGVTMYDADAEKEEGWCGNCGNCDIHCQQWDKFCLVQEEE